MEHEIKLGGDPSVVVKEIPEDFKRAVIDSIEKAIEGYKTGSNFKDKVYEAYAVKKLLPKFADEMSEKNKNWSDVLIRKFLASYLLNVSRELEILEENIEWIFLFSSENPETPPENFLVDFKDSLGEVKKSIERIKKMNPAVLIFDKVKSGTGEERRTIQQILGWGEKEIKDFCKPYNCSMNDFFNIILNYIKDQRNNY